MKKTSLLFISGILIMFGCNNADQSPKVTVDSTTEDTTHIVPIVIVECFENEKGADTVQLRLVDSSGIVSGNLDYRIEGKDANTGTFTGDIYGDTLILDYKFRSEGLTSVRQIAFLKKDSFLVEGFGPVIEENKKFKYKSRDSLTFNQVNRLIRIPCK